MPTAQPDQTLITSDASLEALCDRLEASSVIAIDTEFMGEEHFTPRLELIQVAAEGVGAVIDFPAVQDTAQLTEATYRRGIASSLDNLDAQRSLYSARQAEVAARLRLATNRVTLYRVLGGDQATAPTPAN